MILGGTPKNDGTKNVERMSAGSPYKLTKFGAIWRKTHGMRAKKNDFRLRPTAISNWSEHITVYKQIVGKTLERSRCLCTPLQDKWDNWQRQVYLKYGHYIMCTRTAIHVSEKMSLSMDVT